MESNDIIEREISEALATKKYKMVDLTIFDSVNNLKIEDTTEEILKSTLNNYNEYLEMIEKLEPDLKVKFLQTLKTNEIINNQSMEKENSFLIELYMQINASDAIDNIVDANQKMTKESFLDSHKTLLEGTASAGKAIRHNNHKFVGSWQDGERIIQYFPLDCNLIEESLDKIIALYNSQVKSEEDILIKPFLIHGIISTLQIFEDGNTRLARLYQHTKLWELTNKIYKTSYPYPTLYATKAYIPYRGEYRNIISSLAINSDNATWNKWIKFNCRRIQDQIFKNMDNLEELIRRTNKK